MVTHLDQRNASGESGSLASGQPTQVSLPAEVLGIVAECLAGSYAYGTIASLNVVNHDTRQVTLPILYETLLCDDDAGFDFSESLRSSEEAVPSGVRYTKFLVCREQDPFAMSSVEALHASFPKLSLILTIGDWSSSIPNVLRIRLLRPLRRSTVFGILCKTPIYHAELGHRRIYPAKTLRELTISGEGRLLPNEKTREPQHPPSALQFRDVSFRNLSPNILDDGRETIVELIKEIGQQILWRVDKYREDSSDVFESHEPLTERFHLALVLHQAELETLVEKLSQSSETFTEVLLPHIRFFVRETPSAQFITTILERLRSMHEKGLPYQLYPFTKAIVRIYTVKGMRVMWLQDVDEWSAYEGEAVEDEDATRGHAGYLALRISGATFRFIVETADLGDLEEFDRYRSGDSDEDDGESEDQSDENYDESSEEDSDVTLDEELDD